MGRMKLMRKGWGRRGAAALLCVLLSLCFSGAPAEGAENPFQTADGLYETNYEEILDFYLRVFTALDRGKKPEESALFNPLILSEFDPRDTSAGKPVLKLKKQYGFGVKDLNGDGVTELFIGNSFGLICQVFTMEDGRVRELIRAGNRYSCLLLQGGRFFRHRFAEGESRQDEVWALESGRLVFRVGCLYEAGAEKDESAPFPRFLIRREGGGGAPKNRMEKKEYDSWLKSVETEILNPPFVPLAALETGIGIENIGIISVNGKTDEPSTVRIRASASNKGKLVKKLSVGTYVDILAREGDFYKIRLKRLEGYIPQKFLTVLSDNSIPEIPASR